VTPWLRDSQLRTLIGAGVLCACAHAAEDIPADDDAPVGRPGGAAGAGKGGAAGGKAGSSAGRGGGVSSAGTAGAGGRAAAGAVGAEGGAGRGNDAGAESSGGEVGSQAPTELVVEHKTGNSDPNDNQIRVGLRIKSAASTVVALSLLELRYYFTSEVALPLTIEIYDAARDGSSGYQALAKDAVNADVSGSSGYLELTFTDAAGGLANGDWLTLDIAVHGPNWTGNFSESDDYSFAADHTDFVASEHITLLSGKNVLWGSEPP
jgi:hypothetical protein